MVTVFRARSGVSSRCRDGVGRFQSGGNVDLVGGGVEDEHIGGQVTERIYCAPRDVLMRAAAWIVETHLGLGYRVHMRQYQPGEMHGKHEYTASQRVLTLGVSQAGRLRPPTPRSAYHMASLSPMAASHLSMIWDAAVKSAAQRVGASSGHWCPAPSRTFGRTGPSAWLRSDGRTSYLVMLMHGPPAAGGAPSSGWARTSGSVRY